MDDRNTLQQCYLRVFEGEAGKAVLADIEVRAYVRDTSFNPDPQRTAFNEGRRSLALHIRRMLEREGKPRNQGGEAPAIS